MSHHLVAAEGLSYSYPDGTVALSGVSFRIVHGESVAIVGANGAGKSTLLLHLNGTLLPSAGRVVVGDLPVTRGTLREVRRSVGMVFQDPDDQLFLSTVHDDVAFGPLNMGLSHDESAARVDAALSATGILHLAGKPPYRLSAGEKRRAAIATVLALSPGVLVLDEPTTGLDPRGRRQLIDLLRSFTHTKILATHDMELVLSLCRRTIVLDGGRVRADGPTGEVFSDEPLLLSSGLERPASLVPCKGCGESGKREGP